MKSTISVVIIARNEADRIERCLQSAAWADERIVIDNGSTDQTIEKAKRMGSKIVKAEGSDFSQMRNTGLKAATSDWIFYVDADEQVSPALAKEIKETVQRYGDKSDSGYFVTRDNYYMGKRWPTKDAMQRLFVRSKLQGWHGELHETATIIGSFGTLHEPLVHDTHRTLEQMVVKTNEWSEVEAKLRYKAAHPPVSWWRLLRVMTTGFIQSFFAGGGWKAGIVGWIEGIYQAFSMFITYAKLWELQEKQQQ